MVERVDRGVYLHDETRLYRVLERRARGLLLLENCGAPDDLPLAFTAAQLRDQGLRAVRPLKVPAPSVEGGVV